jgi:hypothetical protein
MDLHYVRSAQQDSTVTDYPINPVLDLRIGGGRPLRSLDEAAEFVREWVLKHPDREWKGVLYRLESARTQEQATDAVHALKALLEANNLLLGGAD